MSPSGSFHERLAMRGWTPRVVALIGALGGVGMGSTPLHGQPQADSSGYVTVEGRTRLYFEIFGNAPDTVIIPGGVMLAPHLESLRERFTLVFYDPRGRGRSDWVGENKRLTMEAEVRDLEAVRSELKISRGALIGFSYMGLAAAIYAADHPQHVSRLVLLAPTPPDHETASRYAPAERQARMATANAQFARARAGVDATDFAAECRRWFEAYGQLYVGDPADAARITTEFCVHENESPERQRWRNEQIMRSLGRRWDYTRKASAIQAPTLVIQGDRDLAASPDGGRRWAELIPQARLIMLAGTGHLPHIERGDRVIFALQRFLAGQWPGEAMQIRSRP